MDLLPLLIGNVGIQLQDPFHSLKVPNTYRAKYRRDNFVIHLLNKYYPPTVLTIANPMIKPKTAPNVGSHFRSL